MQLDLPTGEWSVFATANSPRQALYGGRKQNLYLREAERILAVDLQGVDRSSRTTSSRFSLRT